MSENDRFRNDDGDSEPKGRRERRDRGDRGDRGNRGGDFEDDDRRSSGGGRGRGGPGGGSSAGGAGGRGRRRRGKTYYCPKGKCFDYKNLDTLTRFVSESGKIKPRRQTGNCSRCQRELAREVKRARHLALLPFDDAN